MNNQDLQNLRHSLAHLLAAAVMQLYPDAKQTIGPAIDNGFYYDFDFPTPISDKDLKDIEKKMKRLLPTWKEFVGTEVSSEEAREKVKGNEYKLELINELDTTTSPQPSPQKEREPITFYKSGNFEDLCRGGHVSDLSKIDPDSFCLQKIAGAYWRGDEKNKMLTRIYGLAFSTKEELSDYLKMQEEAEKRDHKKIGAQLDLFVFSELVGAGLPLWTPKGTLVRNLLDNYVWSLRQAAGYQKVEIPHVTKKDLYETSGHWSKYSDDLFRISTREGHEFAMKPMNCPHHTQIFARKPWSYREMPQRYCNTTMCYRDEQTGELSGITRARAFTQDDAHVFCSMAQAKEELVKIWNIVQTFYKTFGFVMKVRLSMRDPNKKENYLGTDENWKIAEQTLREVATEQNADTFDGPGEAAFYGPKLDFMAKDAIGREHQVATIQLDINMPTRFKLEFVNQEGQKETPVMIHAAIMGSIERFLGVLIEHTAGNFPLWLSPVQIVILPIGEGQIEYANKVAEQLTYKVSGIRYQVDDRSESIGKKIREQEKQKTPYMLILGAKEQESGTLSLRGRGEKDLGVMNVEEFSQKIREEIEKKI